jgi:hypothetical protein
MPSRNLPTLYHFNGAKCRKFQGVQKFIIQHATSVDILSELRSQEILEGISPTYEVLMDLIFYKKKLRGFSPQANYTDRATAACRRS